jgi:NAD-dependent dihydropyrimidine dehydrogenase PreA subunit
MTKGTVTIYQDKCNGCEECVLSCPAEVLEIIDGKTAAISGQDCLACRTCEQVCPNDAITISEV